MFTNSCVVFSSVSVKQEQLLRDSEAQRVAVENAEAEFAAQSSVLAKERPRSGSIDTEREALLEQLGATQAELLRASDSFEVCSFFDCWKNLLGRDR